MAKSGMRITNYGKFQKFFTLMGKVPLEARDVFKDGVNLIQRQAIAFAPIDKGNLEEAIKILPYQGNQHYLRAIIRVGGVVGGRDVSRYAMIVHEYAWSKRGPKTRAKSDQAGPRYLTRAINMHRAALIKDIADATDKGISGAVSRSGVGSRSRGK